MSQLRLGLIFQSISRCDQRSTRCGLHSPGNLIRNAHYANKRFDSPECSQQTEKKEREGEEAEVLSKNLETQYKLPRNLRVAANKRNKSKAILNTYLYVLSFLALSTSAAKWNQSSGSLSRNSPEVFGSGSKRDNILATDGEKERERGVRRSLTVINHASLYDKVAVQQQVLCPLRGCESEEGAGTVAGKRVACS